MSDNDGNPVMKPFWEMTQKDVDQCLNATHWRPASGDYFRGGGYSSNFLTRGGMPLTSIRINIVKGLGPVLQLAEGWSIELPEKVAATLDNRTDPTWPTTWFVPRLTNEHPFNDVYSVMNNWGANHAAMAYGHIGGDLITLCSILRIPVYMHNVADHDIFRPSAWTTFGTKDLESADFRACANFGPIYK
jgi:L-fucose isomerase